MSLQRYLSDPLLRDFVPIEGSGARGLVRVGYEEHAGALGLDGSPGRVVAEVRGGRRAHPVVELSTGERVVVREYRRGGLVRHVNRAWYFSGHRAFDELRVTLRAAGAGVRVPDVIAAVERPGTLGYTASLATRWIAETAGFADWASGRDGNAVADALRRIGGQIAAMHVAGITHPDLNLRNILIQTVGDSEVAGVHLIDFDRARIWAGPIPPAVRAVGLRRLARSARKLGVVVDPEGWNALREGYGPAWPPYVRLA